MSGKKEKAPAEEPAPALSELEQLLSAMEERVARLLSAVQGSAAENGRLRAALEETAAERDRLIDFAAYRQLVGDYRNKDTAEAKDVLTWVDSEGRLTGALTEETRYFLDCVLHKQAPTEASGADGR